MSLEEVSGGATGDRTVLANVSMTLTRNGHRIAVIGANGAGKTTLVRMLADELGANGRGAALPPGTSSIGYFAQHQIETLRADETPLAMMTRLFRADREQHLRDFLGGFGFAGEAAAKADRPPLGRREIAPRPGRPGQAQAQPPAARRADQPPRPRRRARRSAMALNEFEGTVMLVSHDRALLREVCDEFWLVAGGVVKPFDGDLDDYQRWLLDQAKAAARAARPDAARPDAAAAAKRRAPARSAPAAAAPGGAFRAARRGRPGGRRADVARRPQGGGRRAPAARRRGQAAEEGAQPRRQQAGRALRRARRAGGGERRRCARRRASAPTPAGA